MAWCRAPNIGPEIHLTMWMGTWGMIQDKWGQTRFTLKHMNVPRPEHWAGDPLDDVDGDVVNDLANFDI